MLRDRDELDFERVADEHLVEQRVARRVVVAVGEARARWSSASRRTSAVLLPASALISAVLPTADEPARLHRERFRRRHRGVDGVDLRVEDDEVGVARVDPGGCSRSSGLRRGGGRGADPRRADRAHDPGTREAHELSTVMALRHRCFTFQCFRRS